MAHFRQGFSGHSIFSPRYALVKIGGGADGTQTHDLYDANVALYQLSYNPRTLPFN